MSFRFFLENCDPVAVPCNSNSLAYILFLLQSFEFKIVCYSISLSNMTICIYFVYGKDFPTEKLGQK